MKVKVFCARGWECGFYHSFEEAQEDKFTFCWLCACFISGGEKIDMG